MNPDTRSSDQVPAVDRRTFLTAAALGAAAVVVAPPVRALADAVADPSLAPFLHGVASGDPLGDRVVLWTRITTPRPPASVPVSWLVAEDPQLRRVVARGRTAATAERDHTVKVDAGGLRPFTTYWYAFEALGRRSMVGRTKTAPGPGQRVDRLRFASTSCSKYDQGFFNAYARMAEADVDAVLHLGDYIYEEPNKADAPGGRFIDPRTETYTLAEYRRRHAQYKLDPDLQAVHRAHPFIAVWDDHESANNAWVDGANRHDPAMHGPFAVRKAAAQRVYDEWMPIRLPHAGDPATIYRQQPYGALADLVVIDTRLEGRSEQLSGRYNDGELFSEDPRAADPSRQLYSPTQRAFLERSLAGSRSDWKLVLNQVLVSQLKAENLPDDVSRALSALGQTGVPTEGVNLATDIWDGYEAERERLLGFLRAARVQDVVVLTGDIHVSMANDLTEDPFRVDVPPAAVEFVTTSITSSNFDDLFGSPPRTTSVGLEAALRAQNPSTKYVELDSNGWTLLDVTRDRVQAEYLFVDTVQERSDGQRLDATWQVVRGQNRLTAGGPPSTDRADRPPAPPSARVVRTGSSPTAVQAGAGAGGGSTGALPATGGLPGAAAGLLLAAAGLLAKRRGAAGD